MAGRNNPRIIQAQQANPQVQSVAVLENRAAAQQHEIQTLLLDNRRLAATHVALKQDLATAQQELRHLSSAAASVKCESEAQVRQFYEKSLRLEVEVRAIDSAADELVQVRSDIQRLSEERKELAAKWGAIEDDIVQARSELRDFPAIKADIEAMRKEIQRGRAAVEYEKKMHATNLKQSEVMEQHMFTLAREIDKLNAELANAEKRARAAAAAATSNSEVTPGYVNLQPGYGGNLYHDPYGVPQVQGVGGSGTMPDYGPGLLPGGLHDPHVIQR